MKTKVKILLLVISLIIAVSASMIMTTATSSGAEVEYTPTGGETIQTSYNAAITAAKAQGGTIKLLTDVTGGVQFAPSIAGVKLTVDVGAHTLDYSALTKHAFAVGQADVSVTIKGTGTVIVPNKDTKNLFYNHETNAAGFEFNLLGEADDRLDLIVKGSSNTFDHRRGTLNVENVDITVNGYSTFFYSASKKGDVVANFTDSSITINGVGTNSPIWLRVTSNKVNFNGVVINNNADKEVFNFTQTSNIAVLENTTINSSYSIFTGKGKVTVKDGVVVTKSGWDANTITGTVTLPSGYVPAYVDDSSVRFVAQDQAVEVSYYLDEVLLVSRLTAIGSAPYCPQEFGYKYENGVLYTPSTAYYTEPALTNEITEINAEHTELYVGQGDGAACAWGAFSGEPSATNVVAASTDSGEIIDAVMNTEVKYIEGYADLSLTHTSRYGLTRDLTIDAKGNALVLNGANSDYAFNPGEGVTLVIKNATVSSLTAKLAYPGSDACNIALENLVINWTCTTLLDYGAGGTFTAKNCEFNFNGAVDNSFLLYNENQKKTLDMTFVDCTVNMAHSGSLSNAFVHLSTNALSSTVTVKVKGCDFNLNSAANSIFRNDSSISTFAVSIDPSDIESQNASTSFASAVPYFVSSLANSSTFTLANGVAFDRILDSSNVVKTTPTYPAGAQCARQSDTAHPYVITDSFVTLTFKNGTETTAMRYASNFTGPLDSAVSYAIVKVGNVNKVEELHGGWIDEQGNQVTDFVPVDGMVLTAGQGEATGIYATWAIFNAYETEVKYHSLQDGADLPTNTNDLIGEYGILRLYSDLSYTAAATTVLLPDGAVIDLNGNTLTMANFRFGMRDSAKEGYTIKNGTLDCSPNNNNILYANPDKRGYANFDTVTFIGSTNIFDIRSGTLNLTNCTYNGSSSFVYAGSKVLTEDPNQISVNINGGNYTTTSDFITIKGTSGGNYLLKLDVQVNGNTTISCGYLVNLSGGYNPASKVDVSFSGAQVYSPSPKLINSTVDTIFNVSFLEGCRFSQDPTDISGSYAPDKIITPGGLAIVPKQSGVYCYAVDIPVSIDWNLTLYTDFNVNFIVRYENIDYVKVNGIKKSLTGARQPDGSYVISVKSVAANLLAENITVEVGYDDGYSVEFTKSVVDYASAIIDGQYNDLTKALVASSMNYVLTAYEYAQTVDAEAKDTPEKLLQLVASDKFSEYLPTDVTLTGSENRGNAQLAIASAQLNLTSKLKFRFNLNESYSGTLIINGKSYTVTDGKVGANELTYVELDVNAFALYGGVITIGGESSDGTAISGAYSLATYVGNVFNTANEKTKSLLSALVTYTSCANDYKAEDDRLKQFEFEQNNGSYVLVGYNGNDKNVVIPGFYEGLEVTEIASYAFAGNTSIESIVISDGVKIVGIGSFKGCTALKSVQISESVTVIGSRAFEGTALTEVVVPDSVEAIGHGAFMGCNELASITLPFVGANLSDSNNHFGYIFGAPSYVANADFVPESLTTVVLSAACSDIPAYSFVGCNSITSITIGSGVKRIGISAFQSCTGLKSVYIPATVTEILAKGFYYNSPFIGCYSELTVYTETADVSAFGQYWCNITENDKAEVISGISYNDYLQAIAD